jgi:hypothetical protein
VFQGEGWNLFFPSSKKKVDEVWSDAGPQGHCPVAYIDYNSVASDFFDFFKKENYINIQKSYIKIIQLS